jgi:hypothetical protein
LPAGDDLKALSDEPFLFFVDADGNYVLNGKARDYLATGRFDYDYDDNGFGENLIKPEVAKLSTQWAPVAAAQVSANSASIAVLVAALQRRSDNNIPHPLMAQVTLARPQGTSSFASSAYSSAHRPTRQISGSTAHIMRSRAQGRLDRSALGCAPLGNRSDARSFSIDATSRARYRAGRDAKQLLDVKPSLLVLAERLAAPHFEEWTKVAVLAKATARLSSAWRRPAARPLIRQLQLKEEKSTVFQS